MTYTMLKTVAGINFVLRKGKEYNLPPEQAAEFLRIGYARLTEEPKPKSTKKKGGK